MSRPAGKVKINVYAESSAVLADEEQDFSGRAGRHAADRHLDAVERRRRSRGSTLRAYDAQGNWVGVEIAPWFVAIPHEDVNFKTDSAEIDEAEAPKLEAAFAKLDEVLAKDTAPRPHARRHHALHRRPHRHRRQRRRTTSSCRRTARARSRRWFRKRGVKMPISYEGFGETSLAVKTADNVDEVKNRRVDYILSDGPPTLSAAFHAELEADSRSYSA